LARALLSAILAWDDPGVPVRNFNIFDPSQWSDVHGFVILMVVIAGTLFGTIVKLIGGRWRDWLDEPRGRASIEDDWLLDRIEQRRSRAGPGVRRSEAIYRLRGQVTSNGSGPGRASTATDS
jgi:hypothetical protein